MIARDYPMPPLEVGDVVVSPMMGPTPASRIRLRKITALALVRIEADAAEGTVNDATCTWTRDMANEV